MKPRRFVNRMGAAIWRDHDPDGIEPTETVAVTTLAEFGYPTVKP